MGALMPDDYQLPEGFVNPVPDQDAKRAKPWANWSLPESGRLASVSVGRAIAGLVVLGFVFSDAIFELAEAPLRDALDSLQEWFESQ